MFEVSTVRTVPINNPTMIKNSHSAHTGARTHATPVKKKGPGRGSRVVPNTAPPPPVHPPPLQPLSAPLPPQDQKPRIQHRNQRPNLARDLTELQHMQPPQKPAQRFPHKCEQSAPGYRPEGCAGSEIAWRGERGHASELPRSVHCQTTRTLKA